MKQRPILVAVIGYVIGILWGLYLKISIIPFCILIFATYNLVKIYKIKQTSFFRYGRYLKLIINSKTFLILLIFSSISNLVVDIQNFQYENTYRDGQKIKVKGIVISQKDEKQYYDIYKVKIRESKFSIYVKINKNEKELKYGDEIYFEGIYIKPDKKRVYKGYDESQYLKTLKIIGNVQVNKVKKIAENQINIILQLANKINFKVKSNIEKIFNKNQANILKGILLGDKQNIDEEIVNRYQTLNISHILAISGMHIGYIIAGVQVVLKRIMGKRKTNVITIIILILYMFITNFSPSIVRATVMGILIIIAELLHRKNDTLNSMAISLFLTLIYNPFLIVNVGLQLSYLGVLGIILFNSTVLKILKSIKLKKTKSLSENCYGNNEIKILNVIKEILSVTISAQIMIMPIMLINFHILGTYSLMSNLLVSIIIGPIIIFSFISIILSFMSNSIFKLFSIPIKISLEILNLISELSQLPFAKIYIARPNDISIILYFAFILIFVFIYKVYNSSKFNTTYRRIRNLIALAKYKFKQKKMKCIKCLLIVLSICFIVMIIPKDLKIYFVDVGQGDSTFIITPKNKTILIDGGGNVGGNFDIGEKILQPYLLNRGYTVIDYIIVSHFDFDHVRWTFYNFKRTESEKCTYKQTI